MADADVRQEKGTTLFSSSWTTCLALSSCHYPCSEMRHFELVVKTCEDHWDDIRQLLTEEQKSGGLNFWWIWPGHVAYCWMLQAPRSQVQGPRQGRLEEKVEATQAEGAQILNEARHLQHFPNTVLLDLYGFMRLLYIIDIYDAAKLRLKAPRKEKNIKKTRCRRCAQVLQVSFHDSKTYCTHNSYIKGYLHYMVIWVAWSHQLLFFSLPPCHSPF